MTGVGGAGKTRLAVEFGADAAGRFRDEAWLADLAGITDPDLVPAQVMEALGVRQTGEMPVIEALRYRLHSAELLLVLDNCEHLLGACSALAEALLGSSPGLRVLATSREPLGVPGEAVFAVPPLAVPPEEAGTQALARAPVVRLFLARSALARAGGAGLDGLPLAIELAAARAGVLSAEEIEAHLADRFRFLAYLRPVADPRHQALEAAVAWSYELLTAGGALGAACAVGVRGRLRPDRRGRGVLRRERVGRARPGRPASRQVPGSLRARRGRQPLPAAGDHPPVRRRAPGRGR
jgi:predicted ATPase